MKIKFGTGGFRGEVKKEFNKESISLIGEALASIILEDNERKEIVVGYDRRYMSKEASQILASIFLYHGIKVNLHFLECPSPLIMYFVEKWELPYGVMITASHNPANFNGIKVFTKGGYDADVEFTERLEKRIDSVESYPKVEFNEKDPNLNIFKGIDEYVENIIKFAGSYINKDLRIAYDNLNGVGIVSISELFNRLAIPMNVFSPEADSSFRGKLPNPIEENLDNLKQFIIKNKFDLGFACDSDADRLGVIDEKGNYVSANEILAVIYYYLIKEEGKKGDIVKNLVTSNILDNLADKFGYKCHHVDVGFKNITHSMKVNDALIGGESSGGLTVRNYIHGKDSTFSVMLFVSAISKLNKPVSEIVKEVKEFANYNKVFLESFVGYAKENAEKIVDFLDNNTPEFDLQPKSMMKFERNYKWEFEDGQWLAIRLSNTEPVIRIAAEFNNTELANKEFDNLAKFIAPLGK